VVEEVDPSFPPLAMEWLPVGMAMLGWKGTAQARTRPASSERSHNVVVATFSGGTERIFVFFSTLLHHAL
jgi:hypothetical protein